MIMSTTCPGRLCLTARRTTISPTSAATQVMRILGMDDFVVRAFLAGAGVALIAGPLGCVMVWRRMAYFGATLAHSALLGIALGLLLQINLNLGVIVVAVVVALLIAALQRQKGLSSDTLLGILAHATLALGLVAMSFVETARIDLLAYLFGDILAVGTSDLAWVYAGGLLGLAVLALIWRSLLTAIVHEDLAEVEGVRVAAVRLAFMILIALVVAVAMKIVGILLIVSMLIIPAATARRFSTTPEMMAGLAALIGVVAVAGGLTSSLQWDTPAGPSIVTAAAALFFVSLLFGVRTRIRARGN